jgi:hypothetical protein
MAIDMSQYRRQRGSSASQSGASADNGSPPVPKSASEYANKASSSSKGSMDYGRASLAGLGAGGMILGSMMNASAEKAKKMQMQINLRLAKEKRANVQQLGQIDIADQMGLALSNRLQGALQIGGSNSEVYAQEGRNMNFSLRSQLHELLVQEVQMQNEIYAMEHKQKMEGLNTIGKLASAGVEVGLAIATGGASLAVTLPAGAATGTGIAGMAGGGGG